MAYIGKKVKYKHVNKIENELNPLLTNGEKVVAVFWANRLKPLTDTLVLTNQRLLCAYGANIGKAGGFFSEIVADDIESADIEKSFAGPKLVITLKDGTQETVGTIVKDDFEYITKVINKMSGSPNLINYTQQKEQKVIAEAEQKLGIKILTKEEAEIQFEAYKSLVTGHVNKPTLHEAMQLSREGEKPEFIFGEINSGALVAFKDRCAIIKKGIGTSIMAGSLGGGRVATFVYRDITSIEYNSGIVNGVLEILTPSYQGTANKDFWSGTFSGRNSNSNDPHTLSNTLPLSKPIYSQVRSKIQWLQEQIAASKHVGSVTSNTDTVSQIEKLTKLHKNGALSDTEFAEAKQRLLNKL